MAFDEGSAEREVSGRPGARRRLGVLVGLGAVLVAVLGAVAVVSFGSDDGDQVRSGMASEPAGLTPAQRFPVLDPAPGGFDAPEAHVTLPHAAGQVEALFGRPTGDSWTDLVSVIAGANDLGPDGGEEVDAGGRLGILVDADDSDGKAALFFPGPPLMVVSGPDPVAFVRSAPTALRARLVEAPPGVALDIGTLPDGYEIVAGPDDRGSDGEYGSVTLAGEGALLQVSTGDTDPLMSLQIAEQTFPVTIGGRPGWALSQVRPVNQSDQPVVATTVVWQEANGVTISLAAPTDVTDTLRIAEDVRLVDADEWQAIYGNTDPLATTTTISGDQNGTRPGK